MIKFLNTLLFVFLLSACSSQEAKENNSTTKAPVEEKSTIQTNKEEVIKETVEKVSTKKETSSSAALFTLKTLAGKTININETAGGLVFEEFKEKAVLLLFFGYRCPPCLAEIPILKALIEKGHKDLEIVALEVQGLAKDQLEAFKQKKGINYHLISGEDNYEFISYIGEKANWQGGIPFLIGFDKKGSVKVVHVGGIRASEFDNIYTTLSQEEKK